MLGRGEKMKKSIINVDTEANKVDSKIIEQLTRIKLKPNKDYLYNVVFQNKKRPDFLIKNFTENKKYSFIIENKLKYKDLNNAKLQALEYAQFLFKKGYLTKYFLLIITDSKSFYISKYKIDKEIIYIEDINYIDCFEDLTIDFFSTNSNIKEEREISIQNQRNLKKVFDKINDKLREYSITSDQRLHLTMAFLFLKLIKENSDLFGKTKYKKELEENLINLNSNVTSTNIKNIFDTISKIFENKFSFSISEYFGSEVLIELWEIIKDLDLDSYDLDVKGEAFEYFINYGSIHSDIGEYFTPRHIVKFMIKNLNEVLKDRWLTNIKGDLMTYIDPTCGTGGFLISIFKQLLKEINNDEELLPKIKTKCVFGVENSKRTSEIAKMNMILAGDGHTNIFHENFLNFKESNKNNFNVSIGNMPFGKKIKEPDFVDGFLDIIKKKGYSIFIVPSGIIGTTSKKDYIRVREKLLTEGRILKIISLPQGVFAPYTFAKTYILFWKKEIQKENYEIEFFDVLNDGFTLNNHRDLIKGDSDLEKYFKNKDELISKKQIFYVNSKEIIDIKEMNNKLVRIIKIEEELDEKSKKVKILKSQLNEISDKKQLSEKEKRLKEILTQMNELKKEKKEIDEFRKNLNYSLKFSLFKNKKQSKNKDGYLTLNDVTNGNIVRGPFGSSIKKSVCVSKEEGGTYKIYEQGNVINENFDIGRYYITDKKFEELNRFEIKENDILMTCAGTLGEVAIVPKKFEKGIFNSVLMRFRCDTSIIRPNYLKLILSSEKIKNMIVKDAIGVGIKNMVPTKEIKEIQIPVPSLTEQDKIIKEMENLSNEIKEYEQKISEVMKIKEKTINYD